MGIDNALTADARVLRAQRAISRATGPLWIGGAVGAMRAFGYRIKDHARVRAEYRAIRRAHPGALMVCANHLTMVDSPLLAWALAPGMRYLLHPREVPWNVPERNNFGRPWYRHLAVYVMRCILVVRGGEREDVQRVLQRVAMCLRRGEPVVIFPEGGRSRSGRVELESTQYGVGRLLEMVPDCGVLCVYMRGEGQRSWGNLPRRGERFHVSLKLLRPSSPHRGLRRQRDVSRQIVEQLAQMERAHLAAMGAELPAQVGSAQAQVGSARAQAIGPAVAQVAQAAHAQLDAGQ